MSDADLRAKHRRGFDKEKLKNKFPETWGREQLFPMELWWQTVANLTWSELATMRSRLMFAINDAEREVENDTEIFSDVFFRLLDYRIEAALLAKLSFVRNAQDTDVCHACGTLVSAEQSKCHNCGVIFTAGHK